MPVINNPLIPLTTEGVNRLINPQPPANAEKIPEKKLKTFSKQLGALLDEVIGAETIGKQVEPEQQPMPGMAFPFAKARNIRASFGTTAKKLSKKADELVDKLDSIFKTNKTIKNELGIYLVRVLNKAKGASRIPTDRHMRTGYLPEKIAHKYKGELSDEYALREAEFLSRVGSDLKKDIDEIVGYHASDLEGISYKSIEDDINKVRKFVNYGDYDEDIHPIAYMIEAIKSKADGRLKEIGIPPINVKRYENFIKNEPNPTDELLKITRQKLEPLSKEQMEFINSAKELGDELEETGKAFLEVKNVGKPEGPIYDKGELLNEQLLRYAAKTKEAEAKRAAERANIIPFPWVKKNPNAGESFTKVKDKILDLLSEDKIDLSTTKKNLDAINKKEKSNLIPFKKKD